jgi:hypothetical protein
MEEIFGWIQVLLTQLGVWAYLTAIIKVLMVLGASTAVFKFLRG